jgi:hypothetical protein
VLEAIAVTGTGDGEDDGEVVGAGECAVGVAWGTVVFVTAAATSAGDGEAVEDGMGEPGAAEQAARSSTRASNHWGLLSFKYRLGIVPPL